MAGFKERMRSLLLNQNTEDQFVNSLFDCVKRNLLKETNGLLDLILEERSTQMLLRHQTEKETILHVAVKARVDINIISRLVDACPSLLLCAREGSETNNGQTPLHIAITQGNANAVETLLTKSELLGPGQKWNILHQRATGSKFVNTVMMGEIPLTVAALKLNTNILEVLIRHGAELSKQNRMGDNVCHSLIKYAHLYPEKLPEILKVCEHISKISVLCIPGDIDVKDIDSVSRGALEKRNIHVWLMENDDGLNPLKLSAKLGQQLLFKYIMELKGVYCYTNSEDGLFDVQLYDVTDIDFASELKLSDIIPVNPFKDSLENKTPESTSKNRIVPTLEMIFNSDASIVFKFIQFSPLHYVINRKWSFYRWFYLIWGILHILFMVGYSVYAIDRSHLPRPVENGSVFDNYLNPMGENAFVTFYVVLSLVFACLYLLQEIVRVSRCRMPWSFSHIMNCYHNGPFRLVLVLFSLCVIADFIWWMADPYYENYLLVCAMVLGWWFLVFFLRAIRQFSFFTVMIQKVLVGDMFRFSIIIGMELIAFTTGIFIAFQGVITSDENNTMEHYGKLMILMFKMMFGFTSLDILFEARQPWFAVCLYVVFVLLTYVLMINSLIAMMSNTCSVVSQNREVQWRVQQLSIILFFESIFPSCCLRLVGHPRESEWYDAATNQFVRKQRHFMEVRSLIEVSRSKSRLRMSPESMIETIFQTIRDIQLPSFGLFESEENEVKHKVDTVEKTRENMPEKVDRIVARTDYRETTLNGAVERKKHKKKKKKVTIEPEQGSGEQPSSHMTEVEYMNSDFISPELAVDRIVKHAAKSQSCSNLESLNA